MYIKWRLWIQNTNSNNIQNGCAFSWCRDIELNKMDNYRELESELAELKTKGKCMGWLSMLFTVQQDLLKLVLMWVRSLDYATGYNQGRWRDQKSIYVDKQYYVCATFVNIVVTRKPVRYLKDISAFCNSPKELMHYTYLWFTMLILITNHVLP